MTLTAPPESLRSALASGHRPKPAGPWSASLTYGWRALLKIKHVPEQLFDVTAFPIMFTLMFTFLFGGALAGSPREYLHYLLPGILAQTVVFITMYTGVTLNTDVQKGIFDRFRTLPVWRPAVLVGMLLGDGVRYALASTIVVVVGVTLGFRPDGGPVGVLAAVALVVVFAFCLTWIWTAVGLLLRTPGAVMGVSGMILFPLTFISDIFVEPRTMPGVLEAIVEANPITWLATAARGLMHGTATAGDVGSVLLAGAVVVAIFGPISMYLFRIKE
jgi:ABC-2 type transport system permease protein